jgi:DNA-binding CsgD family transcriptional regulator
VDLLATTRAEISGDLAQAVALLPSPESAVGNPYFLGHVHGGRTRTLFNAGSEEARAELRAWQRALDAIPASVPVAYGRFLAYAEADESLVALAEDDLVQTAYTDLVRWSDLRFAAWSGRGSDHLRGALALRLGRIDEAERWYLTGLEWADRERCPVEQGRCLQGLAEVTVRRGQAAEAMPLLDRAASIFEQYGARLYLEQVRATETRISSSVAHPSSVPDGISVREVAVLRLLADGQSNKEIAASLSLSIHTVERHLVNIYAKIGARGRADAVVFALRHGLA